MTKYEVKKTIINIICNELFKTRPDENMIEYMDLVDDAGMESISYISIIVELEAEFEITIPDECLLMDNFRNVNDIIAIVTKQLQGENADE